MKSEDLGMKYKFEDTTRLSGGKNHQDVLNELARMHTAKNNDYGDSFSMLFKEFGMMSSLIRLSDKLERLKSLQKNEQQVKTESVEDTLMDLANYSIMTIVELRKNKEGKNCDAKY